MAFEEAKEVTTLEDDSLWVLISKLKPSSTRKNAA
jgi:hypothetical protein